jgi:hypothetical protein
VRDVLQGLFLAYVVVLGSLALIGLLAGGEGGSAIAAAVEVGAILVVPLEMLLGREIVRARRYQRPFSVLLGVVAGVEVDAVVGATQELVRATDEVGAWSEGEILIILSESTDEQARQLLSRLRAHLDKRLPGAGVRFGVATHAAEDSTSTLIERAKRAQA